MTRPAPESTGGPNRPGSTKTAGDFLWLKPSSAVYRHGTDPAFFLRILRHGL